MSYTITLELEIRTTAISEVHTVTGGGEMPVEWKVGWTPPEQKENLTVLWVQDVAEGSSHISATSHHV